MLLITGGASYLGGALANALLDDGYYVRIIDIISSKYILSTAEFINRDIRNKDQVEKALEGVGIVYYLAFVQTPSILPKKMQRKKVNIGRKIGEEKT
jgi:dTDP-L-rhamnose 4-epimerase